MEAYDSAQLLVYVDFWFHDRSTKLLQEEPSNNDWFQQRRSNGGLMNNLWLPIVYARADANMIGRWQSRSGRCLGAKLHLHSHGFCRTFALQFSHMLLGLPTSYL